VATRVSGCGVCTECRAACCTALITRMYVHRIMVPIPRWEDTQIPVPNVKQCARTVSFTAKLSRKRISGSSKRSCERWNICCELCYNLTFADQIILQFMQLNKLVMWKPPLAQKVMPSPVRKFFPLSLELQEEFHLPDQTIYSTSAEKLLQWNADSTCVWPQLATF
jgi:hypothetical protein